LREPHNLGPGSVERTFDRIAPEFDATRQRPWPFVVDWLRDVPPSRLLLDLGCGNGRHLKVAVSMGLECVGLDVSASMLGTARAMLSPTIPLVQGELQQLPFGAGVAGSVLAIAALHHLGTSRGLARAVRELSRVCMPGARVMASVWALDDPEVAKRAGARPLSEGDGRGLMVPWRASPGGEVERYYRAISLGELSELFEGAGLAVEAAEDRGANHVVLAHKI
jgi:tRNA (uracil-5-)-methyltransferase TRM9